MKKNKKLLHLVIDAVLCAFIAVLSFVPYVGFIPLGFTSVTDVHVVVILGAILLGPVDGLILGTFFGICSFAKSLTAGAYDAVFIWPWVSILPRAAFGFFTGVFNNILKKSIHKKAVRISLVAIVSTLVHTLLVYIMYVPTVSWVLGYGFHIGTSYQGTIIKGGSTVTLPLWAFCLVIFLFSCIFEALLAALITAPINSSLEAKFGENYFQSIKEETGETFYE